MDPFGKRVVTCGRDKQTIIWDARTGKIVTVFQAHQDQVAAVALSSDEVTWQRVTMPKGGLKFGTLEAVSCIGISMQVIAK